MLNLFIVAAAGTTNRPARSNNWQAGAPFGSASQTNTLLTTSGAAFQFTGVMLSPARSACLPRNAPSSRELFLCQRYFEKTFLQGTAVAQNTGLGTGEIFILVGERRRRGGLFHLWSFSVRKRASATIVTYYNPGAANANWRDTTTSADKTVASLGATSTAMRASM